MKSFVNKIWLFLPMILFLQGCFDMAVEVDIKDNGHAAAHARYDFSEILDTPFSNNKLSDLNCQEKFAIDSAFGECIQIDRGIIELQFYDIDLFRDGSLDIVNKFFITQYELDVNKMLLTIGQNTSNKSNYNVPNLRKLEAKYSLKIKMPGTTITNNGFTTNDNTITIDGLNILLNNQQVTLKSQKYNIDNIIAMLVILLSITFIIYQKNKQIENIVFRNIAFGLTVISLIVIVYSFMNTRSISLSSYDPVVLKPEKVVVSDPKMEASEPNLTCSDLEYGTEKYSSNMEILAELAHFKDNYYDKYHEDVKSALCKGDMQSVLSYIDYGYVSKEDTEAIIKVLGLSYDLTQHERSEDGKAYENYKIKLMDIGLCNGCVDEVIHFCIKEPNSTCAQLAEKALTGDEEAIVELNSRPDYCKIQ